jgi:transcriptional regulator with XRE-family HTH domain
VFIGANSLWTGGAFLALNCAMRREELLTALGETIRDLRSEAGYSQEAFSYAVGLHRTYVGSIERGERDIGLTNLARIAEALSMPASLLLAQAEKRASRGADGAAGFGPASRGP